MRGEKNWLNMIQAEQSDLQWIEEQDTIQLFTII